MAIDDKTVQEETKWKRTTFGSGLVKGLGITLRHLFSHAVTVQYPDEKDPLPPRSRGVIALKEENCTMCMLCGRECPDWCIYIEGHKERRQPKEPGKRAKAFNVLDRFAIDYALCMYCGICVEVCPYDALFWSPEFEYAEHDITLLTHEKERLNEWMYHVLPPPPLDEGAKGPEFKLPAAKAAPAASAAAAPAAAAAAAAAAPTAPAPPAKPAAPAPAAGGGEDPAAARQRVYQEELAKGSDPRVAEARSKAAEMRAKKAAAAGAAPGPAAPAAQAAPMAPAPAAAPAAPSAAAGEDPAAARERVYQEELAKGSDPRVAQSRAKAAEMRAKKAAAAGAAPAPAAAPAAPPAAEAAAAPAQAAPAAPEAPAPPEAQAAPPAPKPPASAIETLEELREHLIQLDTLIPPEKVGAMTPEDAAIVRGKVYDDEIAKGTEPAVAESLARLAEVVALQGFRRPDWK